MALAKVSGGVLAKLLAHDGFTPEQWESGLAACAAKSPNCLPLVALAENAMDDSAISMLQLVEDLCRRANRSRISEASLLLAGLQNITQAVRDKCDSVELDLEGWRKELEEIIFPRPPIQVFETIEPGKIRTEAFSPGGKRILRRLCDEAESMGYAKADARHLLMALIAHEGGATRYGLHAHGNSPTKLQEGVVLHLQSRAKRQRSSIAADREHLQPLLQHILEHAGAIAARTHADRVAEVHLLLALLEAENPARRLLEDERIDIAQLRTTAERFVSTSDEEEEDVSAMADIETIRVRLRDRLVGQDLVIEQIVPYIELMRFGLTDPERPVGVFFFCGQSGSGKTEMAKELARSLYGSEENLIFLEMGQFNSPESMNIFVGAPPGYVGFGQGKLTNGLRDKPRAVVLFDEVEKAHPRVLDALLRFLDEGKIDDPAGAVRDGSQCVVILTSNVGAEKLSQISTQLADDPFQRTAVRKALRTELKQQNFRVEFLNRVDEVLLFHTLTKENYVEIAGRYLVKIEKKLEKDRQIQVTLDPNVASSIGEYCSEISEGARAVKRLSRAVVLLPVSRYVLKNACQPPIRLKVKALRESRPSGAAAALYRNDEAEDLAAEPVGVVEPATS